MMRRTLLALAVSGGLLSLDGQTAQAQSRPRGRSVTIQFQRPVIAKDTKITKTQFSPEAESAGTPEEIAANPPSTSGAGVGNSSVPQELPSAVVNEQISAPAFGSAIYPAANGAAGARPNVQQMQNPSGGFNMTHFGMTQGQNFHNNSYFGPQFNDWSNLRTMPTQLDETQTFNRFTPWTDSGAYYSPNTYFGNANSQWSNINTGYAVPNYNGGFVYQP